MWKKRYQIVEFKEDNNVTNEKGMQFNHYGPAEAIAIRLASINLKKEYGIYDRVEKCYFKIDRV